MVPGNGLKVYQGAGTAGFELSEPADRVTATVRDANGLVMRQLARGARAAGAHVFQWDGKTDAGAQAVDGAYTVSVEAWRGDNRVSASTLELGRVSAVVRDGAGVSLEVGTRGQFGLPDVRQII
jgi:flagellar basal-body rod modification protein FlgD